MKIGAWHQNSMRIPYLNSAWAGQIPVASDFVAKLQMIFGTFVLVYVKYFVIWLI